ncbi:6-pyruvoyl tetrahydropterin synthase [Teladorsagia circumcincta]|uniref:6-pyruvoyltetrahydropterin synthase n=1 Tax=Teladorsagia circumcincta TaxID=45464 RepID=A0A2G9TUJ6_TELCI|nr:6-pyruvoyl tetrahydropterin synthase [Teladorsagia circumcincta]
MLLDEKKQELAYFLYRDQNMEQSAISDALKKTYGIPVSHKQLRNFLNQHNVSTSENVAIYLWEKLRVQMKTPKMLYKVTVEETPKNIFTYKGEI